MSSAVWKYTLDPADFRGGFIALDMPHGARVISVAEQFGEIAMWALVDPQAEKIKREFYVAGTGHLVPDETQGSYVGSAQLSGGVLVFHVFERVGTAALESNAGTKT